MDCTSMIGQLGLGEFGGVHLWLLIDQLVLKVLWRLVAQGRMMSLVIINLLDEKGKLSYHI